MRATTPEQERRKLQPVEQLRGPWKWADDVSSGGAEVVVLSLPGLLGLVTSGYRPGSVAFAALVGLVVLAIGIAAASRWLRLDPPWPGWGVSTVVFRVVHYSATMLLLGFVGGFVEATVGTLTAVGLITALGIGAVATLPRVLAVTCAGVRQLRRWHAWLFGA